MEEQEESEEERRIRRVGKHKGAEQSSSSNPNVIYCNVAAAHPEVPSA